MVSGYRPNIILYNIVENFPWDYVKDRVFVTAVRDLRHLRLGIQKYVDVTIPPDMERTWIEIEYGLYYE